MENEETDNSVSAAATIASTEKSVVDTVYDDGKANESVIARSRILLLEDSTTAELPECVAQMIADNLSADRQTKADLLAALVYIIGLEVGFVPANETAAVAATTIPPSLQFNWTSSFHIELVRHFARSLPHDYRNDEIGCYTVKLNLFTFPNRPCLLLSREISDALCITLHATDGRTPGKSIYLSASRYVLKTNVREPAKCFQNLRELSVKLKQTIFGPMRNEVLAIENQKFSGLAGIGMDVLWELMEYLDAESLQNLGLTCLALREKTLVYVEKCRRLIAESNRGRKIC